MDLDVYARRGPERELTEEDERAFPAAATELSGGVLSGRAAAVTSTHAHG
jgi:hypothetical protein